MTQASQSASEKSPLAKRYLFLGIGAGMLVATLVIGLGAQFQHQDQQMSSQSSASSTSSSDWKQAAAQAGMVVMLKSDLDKQLSDAKAEGAKEKAQEIVAVPQAPKTVHVYIQPGMGTTDVAMLLQAAGVLENGNALITLRQTSVNPIRSGVYDLPLKANPQDVLKAIATPPKQ